MTDYMKYIFIPIRLIILCTSTLLVSCATGPVDNVGFGKINDIVELEGKYRNLGERAPGYPSVYLSEIIWPEEISFKAGEIDIIEVKKIDEDSLVVRGLQGDKIRKESIFVRDKDFTIASGQIHLGSELEFLGDEPGGNPVIGAERRSRTLGIDKRGHGKYREGYIDAGVLFIFIPIVAGGSDEVRFIKVED